MLLSVVFISITVMVTMALNFVRKRINSENLLVNFTLSILAVGMGILIALDFSKKEEASDEIDHTIKMLEVAEFDLTRRLDEIMKIEILIYNPKIKDSEILGPKFKRKNNDLMRKELRFKSITAQPNIAMNISEFGLGKILFANGNLDGLFLTSDDRVTVSVYKSHLMQYGISLTIGLETVKLEILYLRDKITLQEYNDQYNRTLKKVMNDVGFDFPTNKRTLFN